MGLHVVKDRDGNEWILNDDEYALHRSTEEFKTLAGAVLQTAHARGGVPLVLNVVLFALCGVLYLIGTVTGSLQPNASLLTKLAAPVLPVVLAIYLIRKFRWIAMLVQALVLFALFKAHTGV